MTAIEIDNVTVKFGGLTAVSKVSMTVKEKEIFSVIGPNGAGKTTLFNAITGIYTPSEGRVLINGQPTEQPLTWTVLAVFLLIGLFAGAGLTLLIHLQSLWESTISNNYTYQQPFSWYKAINSFCQYLLGQPLTLTIVPLTLATILGIFGAHSVWQRTRRSPNIISELGVVRTFQNIRLFSDMTVLENILVGMDRTFHKGLLHAALRSRTLKNEELQQKERALEILSFIELVESANLPASCLPYGHQRRLEIGRALAIAPKILLLDEPAAGMNPSESHDLMELIRRIRDCGITVLLIEHHMKVVMEISDRVMVLDYGNKIAEGTPAEIRGNSKVIEAYLGKEK